MKQFSEVQVEPWGSIAGIGDARAGTLSWAEAAKLGLVRPKTSSEK